MVFLLGDAADPDLRWRTIDGSSHAIVEVAGEIDIATIDQFEQALRAHRGRSITVDMGAVTFCGAVGLRSLLAASAERRATGHSLTLRFPSPCVRRLLEVTGTHLDISLT